jgi:8-oxo-dGTP pyrophosphatase MutT (NUDIX family)
VAKKQSVGLVVLTEIPSMGGVVAILQRRGKFNHEKMGPESWPGGCQVTCHGKVEEVDEGVLDALQREIEEEFGWDAVQEILPDPNQAILLSDEESESERALTYGVLVPPSGFLREGKVSLNASSGGLDFVTRDKVGQIQELRNFDKRTGVTDLNTIAMFSDEIEAVRLAFEKLNQVN